ncbi:hypothetical protein CYMTET_23051 [Cymbomonas tetramitiformis]|uniref:Tudor domain-containing protein n=1 Tax=Cymbomonas tetramitiformis TaxID=36881 RepID=A0AAE0FZ87_9CHLO|nr:hypothetical protein CYMTET_23051 [Cymbomonas tetramitiformis]
MEEAAGQAAGLAVTDCVNNERRVDGGRSAGQSVGPAAADGAARVGSRRSGRQAERRQAAERHGRSAERSGLPGGRMAAGSTGTARRGTTRWASLNAASAREAIGGSARSAVAPSADSSAGGGGRGGSQQAGRRRVAERRGRSAERGRRPGRAAARSEGAGRRMTTRSTSRALRGSTQTAGAPGEAPAGVAEAGVDRAEAGMVLRSSGGSAGLQEGRSGQQLARGVGVGEIAGSPVGAATSSPQAMSWSGYAGGAALLGRRVRVVWPAEGASFDGTVHSWSPENGQHQVRYHDGDVQWHVLSAEQVEWLSQEQEQQPQEGVSPASPPCVEGLVNVAEDAGAGGGDGSVGRVGWPGCAPAWCSQALSWDGAAEEAEITWEVIAGYILEEGMHPFHFSGQRQEQLIQMDQQLGQEVQMFASGTAPGSAARHSVRWDDNGMVHVIDVPKSRIPVEFLSSHVSQNGSCAICRADPIELLISQRRQRSNQEARADLAARRAGRTGWGPEVGGGGGGCRCPAAASASRP